MTSVDETKIKESALWNHITTVLSHVVSERPEKAVESLVPTSNYVLTGKSVAPKTTQLYTDSIPMAKSDVPVDAVNNLAWAAHYRETAAPPKPRRRPNNGEEEEEEETVPSYLRAEPEPEELPAQVSDVVTEQSVLNRVGAGVPPEESYRLLVGLQRLARSEPVSSVRLWGRIKGSVSDYFIAEAKHDPSRVQEEEDNVDGDEEEEEGLPVSQIADVLAGYQCKRHQAVPNEEFGTGVNELVFYASSSRDPTSWTRLPDLTTNQVITARKIRAPFTGNLEATVPGHPRFPGVEKHYLRAQIARIQSSCRVAPRDIFTTEGAVPEEEDEDGNPLPTPDQVPAYSAIPPLNPQDVPDEEDTEAVEPVKAWFTGYPDDELLQSKFWVHVSPTLLQSGRLTRHTTEPTPDAEGVEPEEVVEHVEQINPFLSDLSRDATLAFPGHSRQNLPAWVFRKAFHNESSTSRTYAARSLVWPGAITYAVVVRGKPGAEYQMFYCGNGLKSTQGEPYSPELPPRPLVEFSERNIEFQRDCTPAEEATYAPVPRPKGEEEGEEEEEDD